MYEYLITFVVAFIIAFTATPMVKRLAFKMGAVSIPKDRRRMHKKPMALLGGAAMICGFVLSILFDAFTSSALFPPGNELLGLLCGIVIITAMGILDDIFTLRAYQKLAFQLAAAILVVVVFGTRITILTNPFSSSGYIDLPAYISYPLTIAWIVGITNAVNFIDGLDGLAAGVASISSLSLFFVSILRTDLDAVTAIYTAMVTAALAGSTLGFLPFNFNPAKIFMGETGSAFLGFTLGVIAIQGSLKSYAAISITIPLLVLGLPLFDTAFAILRRIKNRKPIYEADRAHLHHRLIDMGLSQKQSVVIMYSVSAALGLCAIVLADRGVLSAIILLIALSIFVIGGARYMTELGKYDYNVADGAAGQNAANKEQGAEEKATAGTEEKSLTGVEEAPAGAEGKILSGVEEKVQTGAEEKATAGAEEKALTVAEESAPTGAKEKTLAGAEEKTTAKEEELNEESAESSVEISASAITEAGSIKISLDLQKEYK